ncbi:MAG: GDSL-type esterase/lipase family protein [Proteobacteria bacterium]|nr:GDSL-type esterase/lipase family protein [Pseudomonadota bacterium]MCZ6783351.1 GDSL-type esterase/lipase family protein [Pseudomonadota bacterium]
MSTTSPPRRTAPLPLSRKLLFSAVVLVAVLGGLETLARLLVPPRDARIHLEHENMITVLGLEQLNRTMVFDPDLFWRLADELRDVRVTGNVRGNVLDFRVTAHDGLRSPPVAESRPALRVLALGDSCTFGIGVENDETWPAVLETALAAAGLDAEVINAGVPGYSAYQGLRFLETRGRALRPDVLVVSFGFNDRDLWSSRSDLETAASLQLAPWETLALRSRLVVGLRRWLRADVPDAPPDGSEASASAPAAGEASPAVRVGTTPRLSPREFYDALGSMKRIADELGARLVLVGWPYRSQVDQGIREAVRYQIVMERLARDARVPMVHLAPPFIDAGAPLFVDHVHANAEGHRVAARAIEPWVTPR